MSNDYKPWLEYPELFATESAWWTYLRGALRRGLWEKSPIKLSFKNGACSLPPEGYNGRAKSGAYCALTGEWEGKSKLEVDHQQGHMSLLSWDDVLPFIMHLVPPKGSLQLVKKDAHKIKSYAERMGITFEQAMVEKQTIEIIKNKEDKSFLESKGIQPEKNASLRRKQIVEYLTKELNNE